MIDLSVNEVTALSRKAARGAGYDWATAEEAGLSVGWLTRCGQDGAGALAALLEARDREAMPGACPLLTGLALSDRLIGGGEDAGEAESVAEPLLVLPFIGYAARRRGQPLIVTGRGQAVTDGAALVADGDWRSTSDLAVGPGQAQGLSAPAPRRASLSDETLNTLSSFAHRTYAPATEASRMLGAGAGQTDND